MADSTESAVAGERVGVVVIHGVGETAPGWINEFVVDRLEKHAKGVTFEGHSEVHALRDHAASNPKAKFDVYLRRGRLDDGRQLALMELFWADLSRIGKGPFTSTIATIRLFYEAPFVFGSAALRERPGGLLGLLRMLILFANWLLRWPISGTNVAALFCCIVGLALQFANNFGPLKPLLKDLDVAYPLGVTLLLLSGMGLWVGRKLAHRDIALADVGLSTFVFSGLMFIALLVQVAVFPLPDPHLNDGSVAAYLLMGGTFIMPLWFLWSTSIVLAIVLLALLAVGRLLRLGTTKTIPLARPAAALGLSTIQGMIWKIFVALFWVIMITAMVKGALTPNDDVTCPQAIRSYCNGLNDLSSRLLLVSVSNLVMLAVLALTVLVVVGIRMLLRRSFKTRIMKQRLAQPRLIVSQLVIMVMFLATLVNFHSFYADQIGGYLNDTFKLSIPEQWTLVKHLSSEEIKKIFQGLMTLLAAGGTTALLVYLALFRSVRDASTGLLHIARDLVDHQYSPYSAMSRRLLPHGKRLAGRFPRRERIQKRLFALMGEVVARERFDRLIFVGHSQGTVILNDYLRSKVADHALSAVGRIDVVTLGSPLSHIYQHYFPDYDADPATPDKLNPNLASWTNFWRIDDPIGNRVAILKDDFIDNRLLPVGGHVDYWREREVCTTLFALICGNGPGRPGTPGLSEEGVAPSQPVDVVAPPDASLKPA